MSVYCDYYGTGWEDDDPACDDCPKWVSCKKMSKRKKSKKKVKEQDEVTLANRVAFSYHTNPRYVLPAEGEPAASRMFKNMVAAAISAIGGELYVFFQEWRWPFTPPALPGVVDDNDDRPPKTKIKMAKKIKVNDKDEEDDDYDFDLDDL